MVIRCLNSVCYQYQRLAVLVREVKTIILNSSYDIKDYCRLQWEFV